MGTGIVATLLHNFPYGVRSLDVIANVVFCLNILLFGLFSVVSLLRYYLFPGLWSAMLRHPVQSLFLGTLDALRRVRFSGKTLAH